ncbi:hypothetical protein [uncultured Microbacterium sp.]|uniref:hypothetical protein n=1 Tax=uncultured Microbacterium sp. TaxID=191216 RepID=UPI0025CDA667|nr:hypothetical protein [uncultured Microbacterium sp.]
MTWDIGNITDSGNEGWVNVGNTSTTNNSTNLGVDLDNVGNVDTSVEENTSTDTTVVDSGNVDSGNTDWDIDGSFNDNSDNSDNSVDAVIEVDSHNTYLDESMTDNSTNAGVREYNTGFQGFAGFGGGDASIHSQATILDQSVNGNILAGGGVSQSFANSAVSASGEGAVAAGDDVSISRSLDASTNITSLEGDINMNNTTEITTWDNVGNTTDISVELTDNSQDWSIDNSYNDGSLNVDVTDSFNEDFSTTETENWTINADVVWGSGNSEVVDVQLPDFDVEV